MDDPSATHRQDQADAAERDQITWTHQVRMSDAAAMQAEAAALLTMARARFWRNLATDLTTLWVIALLWVIARILGWV